MSDSEDPLSGSSSSVPVAQCAAAEEGWDRVRPKREFEGEEEEEEEEEEDSISEASSDEFFDADTELEYPMSPTVVTSPSLSVPVPEGDPPDVEEEQDLVEEDDTSGDLRTYYYYYGEGKGRERKGGEGGREEPLYKLVCRNTETCSKTIWT